MQGSDVPSPKMPNFGRTTERPDVADSPELERVRKWLLHYNIECLYGPADIECAKDDVVVLCLLRNGKPYIESFIDHYISYLGAKHIVFLDNNSTDGTVEALEGYENITVLRSTLPFNRYQLLMRQYLVKRFGRKRWSLLVDIDELFDYPFSTSVNLKTLLGYLNKHSYTSVAAYMLDMFPEKPLRNTVGESNMAIKELHRFYDLSNIIYHDYHAVEGTGNVLANEEIKLLQGGVQKRIFKLSPILLKHPLVFLDDEVQPADMSEHWVGNSRVADFAGVLFHYKLSGTLYALVRNEVEERRYILNSKYDKYISVLEKHPEILVKNETSRELESVNDLVGNGFLPVSAQYMELVQERAPDKVAEAFFKARLETEFQKQNVKDQKQNVKVQKQKVKNLQQKSRTKAGKIEKLRVDLANERNKVKSKALAISKLQNDLARESNRASSLQQQLEGVWASRSWRALNRINWLRVKALQKFRRS